MNAVRFYAWLWLGCAVVPWRFHPFAWLFVMASTPVLIAMFIMVGLALGLDSIDIQFSIRRQLFVKISEEEPIAGFARRRISRILDGDA